MTGKAEHLEKLLGHSFARPELLGLALTHSSAPGDGLSEAEQRDYPSGGPARFALEMEQGWFTAQGISPHSRIRLHPAIKEIRPR